MASNFQPCLTFESKAGIYPLCAPPYMLVHSFACRY